MYEKKMSSALGPSIGWGALIQETNLKNFLSLLTKDEQILPGSTRLTRVDQSIFCLVTIPRVRPHKYMDLTKAEGLVFIIFAMMNDIVITMSKKVKDQINQSFTADTVSKLSNLGIMIDNLENHKRAIQYAFKVCVLNIKRKETAPAFVTKFLDEMFLFCRDVVKHPDMHAIEETSEMEDQVFDAIQTSAGRSTSRV